MPDEANTAVAEEAKTPIEQFSEGLKKLKLTAEPSPEPEPDADPEPEPEPDAKQSKRTKAEPKPDKDVAEPDPLKIEPDALEFTPRTSQQWKEAKGKYQSQIDQLQSQLKEAKAADELLRELGGPERVKSLQAEVAQLTETIRTGMVERDPGLNKRFNSAKAKIIDELKVNVTGSEAADLVSIIERQGSAARGVVRKFIQDHPDIDRFVADDIASAINELGRIERERQTLIEESVANYDKNIALHQQAEQQRMAAMQQEAQKAFVGELEAYKDHPFLSGDEGAGRVEMAKAVMAGALPPSEQARAALMAAAYAPTVDYANRLAQENASLREKLAKIQANTPGAGAAAGKPGERGSSQPGDDIDPRKARYNDKSAWTKFSKGLHEHLNAQR